MKKFIKNIILFGILFVIANFVYLFIISKLDWNFSKSLEASRMENESYDCLILGNSLAMDGIDCEYLTRNGISSYNLSIGGAFLNNNFIQLHDYLKFNHKPKVVILGLASCYDLNYYLKRNHPIIEYTYNLNDYSSVKSLPVIKYKWLATELLKKIVSKEHREAELVLGQLRINRIVPDITKYGDKLEDNFNEDKYRKLDYLIKLDSLCTSNNIVLLIVEFPGNKNVQNDIPIGPYEVEYVEGKHFKIINLNNREFCAEIFDSNNDWLGKHHLNIYGAEKLSKYIYENYLLNYLK